MIEILKMPLERRKFYAINDCIDLRRYAEKSKKYRIGFSTEESSEIDEFDRTDSYHILNYNGYRLNGYGRLRPIPEIRSDCSVSRQIDELSKMMNRQPAFELQRVSADADSGNPDSQKDTRDIDLGILCEIVTQAFRICNLNSARFLFCSSDRGGMDHLRDLGVRYSTLSTPFEMGDTQMVILSIAVNNSNFAALNPFRVVGGSEVQAHLPPTSGWSVQEPTIFEKVDALRETQPTDDW